MTIYALLLISRWESAVIKIAKAKAKSRTRQFEHHPKLLEKNLHNSSWSETEFPINFFPPAVTNTIIIWKIRRLNHIPHNSYICIFPTRLHVLVQIHKPIIISCNNNHHQEHSTTNEKVLIMVIDCKLNDNFTYVAHFVLILTLKWT